MIGRECKYVFSLFSARISFAFFLWHICGEDHHRWSFICCVRDLHRIYMFSTNTDYHRRCAENTSWNLPGFRGSDGPLVCAAVDGCAVSYALCGSMLAAWQAHRLYAIIVWDCCCCVPVERSLVMRLYMYTRFRVLFFCIFWRKHKATAEIIK